MSLQSINIPFNPKAKLKCLCYFVSTAAYRNSGGGEYYFYYNCPQKYLWSDLDRATRRMLAQEKMDCSCRVSIQIKLN